MTSAEPMVLELENIKAGTKVNPREIMTLIHQETPTHLIYGAASRPRIFLTSDVCSRYDLEATGQARYRPVGEEAAAWDKQLPPTQKLPRRCILLSLKVPTGIGDIKTP